MNRTDRLRADVRRLAAAGDSPELHAAVREYIAASERAMSPWWERAFSWYMRLPHNRYVLTPLWEWANRHAKVALPLATIALIVEVWLLRFL